MPDMTMLDAFIGLVFVYATLSITVTAVGQAITQWQNLRGRVLKDAIDKLLGADLAKKFYEQPVIQALQTQKAGRPPSYIPNDAFSAGLASSLLEGKTSRALNNRAVFQASITSALEANATGQMNKTLATVWKESDFDKDSFIKSVEHLFQNTTDRLTGEFKRRLSRRLIAVGFLVAAALNVNTIHMYQQLTSDRELRNEYVGLAVEAVEKGDKDWSDLSEFCPAKPEDESTAAGQNATEGSGQEEESTAAGQNETKDSDKKRECSPLDIAKQQALDVMPLIGWTRTVPPMATWNGRQLGAKSQDFGWWLGMWLYAVVGWFLTAVALSLGAPFWFDMLQRLVNLRGSLKPSGKKADDEKSGSGANGGQSTSPPALKPADLESLSSLKEKEQGYDELNAFWTARFAELAYKDRNIAQAQAREWGAEASLIEADKDTQVLLVDAPDCLFVAFRGTETDKLADILTDLKYGLVNPGWSPAVKVHEGFLVALDAAWDQLVGPMALAAGQGKRLWLCGHSLGGALAVLASHRLLHEGVTDGGAKVMPSLGPVYTFGQPRVGDPAFAREVDQHLGSRYFRSVNNRDSVPLVPPTPMGYEHAGHVLYFNEFGRFVMDPPTWYRNLDKLEYRREEIPDALKQAVSDHSMAFYVRLHGQLLHIESSG